MTLHKKINTIIVDDEPSALELLESVLSNIPEINNLNSFYNADDALDFLANGLEVEMIFLDIEMPVKNGFDFLRELIEFPISPSIVFTTGFAGYSIQAIKAAAFDYLLKPIGVDDIRETIRRYKICTVRENMKASYQNIIDRVDPGKILKFKNLSGVVLVHFDNIVYIQSNGNYSYIYQAACKQELVTMQLGLIEKNLPKNQFFRISRQLIINVKFLTKVNKKSSYCVLSCEGKELRLKGSGKPLKALIETI